MCEHINVEIRNDQIKKTKNSTEFSKCDIYFIESEYSLHIYTGNKNANDIRIRYKKRDTNVRTPKHSHWVLDMVLKKEKYPESTNRFISLIEEKYARVNVLPRPEFDLYRTLINDISIENLDDYKELSNAGEYPIDFLYLLIVLLIAQEKTNYPSGGLFQGMIKSLKYDKIEVFKLLGSEWWK